MPSWSYTNAPLLGVFIAWYLILQAPAKLVLPIYELPAVQWLCSSLEALNLANTVAAKGVGRALASPAGSASLSVLLLGTLSGSAGAMILPGLRAGSDARRADVAFGKAAVLRAAVLALVYYLLVLDPHKLLWPLLNLSPPAPTLHEYLVHHCHYGITGHTALHISVGLLAAIAILMWPFSQPGLWFSAGVELLGVHGHRAYGTEQAADSATLSTPAAPQDRASTPAPAQVDKSSTSSNKRQNKTPGQGKANKQTKGKRKTLK